MQPNVTMADELPEVTLILNTTTVFPDQSAVESQLQQLQASSPTYQAALQELQSRNLQVRADVAPPFGWNVQDESVDGSRVQSLTFIQDLGSDAGQDTGLLGQVVRGTDERGRPVMQERWEIVQKPSGGVTDLSDITVVAAFQDGGALTGDIQALSLFSRFISCVRNSCAQVCLGALTACAGVFPVYLKCVAVACGGCALKCGACAACNCGLWCRWAAGCCRG